MLKVFLDANVYFAAFLSAQGASHLILEIASRNKILLCASKLVLREAERNLRLKSTAVHLRAFRRYLQKNKICVVPAPDGKILEPFEALIHPKDLPVLGAALMSRAEYLITLDRRHFFGEKLQTNLKSLKVMTPGDFLRGVYLKGKY